MGVSGAAGAVDVLVAGAGLAGGLTALLAARQGLNTWVVEREPFPRWKVCGACLNGAGRSVLQEVGLGGVADGGVPLHDLALVGWGRCARVPVQESVVVRRSVLDTALLEAARQEGARFVQGTVVDRGRPVGAARWVPVRTGEGIRHIQARVVVDASGLVGVRSGEDARDEESWTVAPRARIGVGAVFAAPAGVDGGGTPSGGTPADRMAAWSAAYPAGSIHMVVGDAGYVGLVRTAPGELNVAGALDPEAVREAGGPGPAVAAHLAAAGVAPLPGEPIHGWRGTPALTRRAPVLAGDRYLRLGDAAGYVEPFTGEGMAWALAGARAAAALVAEGVEGWHPSLVTRWQRIHRERIGRRQRICRGVAWLSRRPALARTALTVLERAPWLAAPFSRETSRPFHSVGQSVGASRSHRGFDSGPHPATGEMT